MTKNNQTETHLKSQETSRILQGASRAHNDIIRQLASSTRAHQERLAAEASGNAQDKVAKLAKSIHEKNEQRGEVGLAIECAKMVDALTKNFWEPAFTAHPTNPANIKSEEIVSQLRELLYNHATIDDGKIYFTDPTKEAEFNTKLQEFVDQPVIAPKPLTVSQEIERNNRIYKTALAQFADMKDHITQSILRANGYIDPKSIAYKKAYIKVSEAISSGVAQSFNHMHFWSGTDADGNRHICPNTMEKSLRVQRQTLLDFYQQQSKSFKGEAKNISKELEKYEALLRKPELLSSEEIEKKRETLLKAIRQDRRVFYDSKIKDKTKKDITEIEDADLATYTKLRNLEDLINHVGLEGPALDVRQTTKELHPAMGYFISKLADFPGPQQQAIKKLLQDHQRLTGKNTTIKAANKAWQDILGPTPTGTEKRSSIDIINDVNTVLSAIRNDLAYRNQLGQIYEGLLTTDNIKQAKGASPKDKEKEPSHIAALREILRFDFLSKYNVGGRYRISDCKTANDIAIASTFEETARQHLLKAGEPFNEKKLSIIPLAETQQDIENLPNIVSGMLDAGLYANNELVLFPGYSDAEKRMGLAGLAVIQQAMFDSLEQIRLFNLNKVLKADSLNDNEAVINFKKTFAQYIKDDHINLMDMQMIDTASPEYQKLIGNLNVQVYLSENGVKTRISHGEGSDILRGGNMMSHRDSTRQGIEAAYSLDPEYNAKMLRHMMGIEDPYEQRALYDIGTVNGDATLRETFNAFKDASVISHRKMFAHQVENYTKANGEVQNIIGRGGYAAKALDEAGLGFIVDLSNKSSRAGSKSPFGEFNFEDGRAIGVALKLRSSNTGADLVGVASLEEIAVSLNLRGQEAKLEAAKQMHQLAQNSSVTQEIFYKTLWMGLNTDFNRPYLVSGLTRPNAQELVELASKYDKCANLEELTTAQILAKMELQSFKAVEMALCSLAPEAQRQQILKIFEGDQCGIGADASQRSITKCIDKVLKIPGISNPMLQNYVVDSQQMEPIRLAITDTIKQLYQCVEDNRDTILGLIREFNAGKAEEGQLNFGENPTALQKLNFLYSYVIQEEGALNEQYCSKISPKDQETIRDGVNDLIYLFRAEQKMPDILLQFEAQLSDIAQQASAELLERTPPEMTSFAAMQPLQRNLQRALKVMQESPGPSFGTQIIDRARIALSLPLDVEVVGLS